MSQNNTDGPAAEIGASAPPMINVSPPPPLRASGSDIVPEWNMFKTMYQNYRIIAQLERHSPEYQQAIFLHSIGPKGIEMFNGLSFGPTENKLEVDLIIKKLDDVIIGETNVIYERYVFNNRKQTQGETVDDFVASLRKLAKSCKFGEIEEELIRDRIVVGIYDNHTRKVLLQHRKLTLKNAIDICRSAEATQAQLLAMSGDSTNTDAKISKVHVKSKSKSHKTGKSRDDKNNKARKCLYCCQ